MNLTAIVFAALMSLVRPSVHWAPVPEPQALIIADDIALAAQMLDGAPFTGDHRVEKLALALAAIVVHESNLAEKVASCRYAGDPLPGRKPGDGRSITVFQLMRGASWRGHTRAAICSSGPLAAYLAARVLSAHRRAPTPLGLFRGYASGDVTRNSAASERQCRMWVKVLKQAGVPGSCHERLHQPPRRTKAHDTA